MPLNQIPLKSYHYRPQGRRTIGRPKKRWRKQLKLWRGNGSKCPILDVYDDDDDSCEYKKIENVLRLDRREFGSVNKLCNNNKIYADPEHG
jgi:anti-sigma factor ChrR (cupin superfamily)